MNFTAWNLINYSLLTIATFLSMISSFILLRDGKWRLLSNFLLVIYLLATGMACCMVFLTTSELIKVVPWLYRIPSPLYYAMFPAGYLYVVVLLEDRNKLRPWEWLFFLPAFIHLIEMMPFYLQSNDYKRSYLEATLNKPFGPFFHSEGWLPVYTHNMLRGLIGVICGIGIVYRLVKARKQHPKVTKQYPGLYKWLWLFGGMMLVFAGAIFITFFQSGHWKSPQTQSLIMTYCFSFSLIVSTTVLLLYPSYLYGMPRIRSEKDEPILSLLPHMERMNDPLPPNTFPLESAEPVFFEVPTLVEEKPVAEATVSIDPGLVEVYESYRLQLENHMQAKQPFLQHNYKIADLARELGIPQHHLTIVLNKVMKMRFNDFVNQYRIAYIKNLVAQQGLTHSLEGFASLAGFSNRVTFTRAVQRITGQSPSQYFAHSAKPTLHTVVNFS
jgi:AraC-like DNA-binding protein